MEEVLVFKFPDLSSDNRTVIEHRFCEILKDYRNGLPIQPEVLDWFDGANNFLMTMEN